MVLSEGTPRLTEPAGLDLLMKNVVSSSLIHVDKGVLKWRPDIEGAHWQHGVKNWNFSTPSGVLYFMYRNIFGERKDSSIIPIENQEKLQTDTSSFFHDKEGKIQALDGGIGPGNILPSLEVLNKPTHTLLAQKLRGKKHLALLGSINPFSAIGLANSLEKKYLSEGALDLFEINAGTLQMFHLMDVYSTGLAIMPQIQTDLVKYVLNRHFQLPRYEAIFVDVLGTYIQQDDILELFNRNLMYFLKPGGTLIIRDIASKPIPDSEKLISNTPPVDISGFVYWLNSIGFQGGEVEKDGVDKLFSNLWGDSGSSRHESLDNIYDEAFKPWVENGGARLLCNKNLAINGVSPDKRYLKMIVAQKLK